MKKIVALAFILFSFLIPVKPADAQLKKLKPEDIFGSRQFSAKRIDGFSPMKDDLHYTTMISNPQSAKSDIVRFEYATGKVKDTLVRGSSLVPQGESSAIDYSEYEFSRNENYILFTTSEQAVYRHSTRAEYFIYNRKNGRLLPVSKKGKQMYATLSPDEKRIAFVRDNNLFSVDVASGNETQLTFDGRKNEIINGANDWVYEEEFSFSRSFEWSPDGNRIAYYKFDESRVKEFTLTFYDSLYPREERYKYPKAGEENSIVGIFIYDFSNGRTLKASTEKENDQYIPRIKWTADPQKLCIMRMNRHQDNLELLLCDATNGSTRVFYSEVNKYYIDIEINDNLYFTSDRQSFVWLKPVNGFTHILLCSLNGTAPKQITSGNWDVTAFYGMNEKTKTFFYQCAESNPMQRQVYSITLSGKKTLLGKSNGTNRAEFTPAYSYFVHTWSDANTPPEVALYNSNGKILRMLENNSELKTSMGNFELTKKEFFKFTTSAGTELNGWMIKPASFDPAKKYPVFMYMYGGPGAQTVNDAWEGSNYFYWQMLAQRGYVVVSVDNRGTGARGEEFQKCTFLNLGKLETEDQIETAKYLASHTWCDAARIGVFGWSYGGYMASLLMTKGADYFKAGIAVAPVTTWRYYDTIYTERYLHTPQENPKGYDENSPLNFADKLKGKFLLVHGTTDDNVHYQNSMDFVTALVKAKKQFQTFFYPNKNHSLPGYRLHLYNMMTDFIESEL